MFDLDDAMLNWKKQLRKNQAFEDGYIKELESHLRDEFEEGVNRGLDEEKAFLEAVEKIGIIENLGEDYYKSDTKKLSKRPPWKVHPIIPALLYNYFKTAARNIKRNKAYTIINVVGLTISLVAFAIFALGGHIHLGADKFHENAERIFGIIQKIETKNKEIKHTAFLPAPVLPALQNDYPEIETGVRVSSPGRLKFQHQENVFYEQYAFTVDDNFLEVFSYNLIIGNKNTALKNPNSIILTERSANKYFGDENPLGKQIIINDKISLTVTAVMENISKHSSLRFDFLIPIAAPLNKNHTSESWETNNCSIFLLMKNRSDSQSLEAKLDTFVDKYWDSEIDPVLEIYLMPLTDFRLKADDVSTLMRTANLPVIIISMSFGALLLMVASFNFINLSIARFMTRIKEIGMRKVIGAKKSQIVRQFLTESIIISLISFVSAIILYEFTHPVLTSFTQNTAMSGAVSKVSNSLFNYPYLVLYILAAALFSGLLSGIFPAFHISGVKPIDSLCGSAAIGKSKRRGTKILVVAQFTISVIIIVFATLFSEQFEYWVKTANFGYSRENVVVVELPDEIESKCETIRSSFLNLPSVVDVSASQNIPGLWSSRKLVKLPTMLDEEASKICTYGISYNFTEVFEIEILSGRSFSRLFNDSQNILINEEAVNKFGMDNPIDETIVIDDNEYRIVGITENFVFNDIGFDIDPAVLYLTEDNLNYLLVKLNEPYTNKLQKELKENWRSLFPNVPYESFDMEKHFEEMMNMGGAFVGIINLIGYLAVLFSYIGLIGLISFLISRRTKEIGIRKVLGASVNSIMKNIIKEFLLLVALANIIAFTACYYLWGKIIQTGLLYMQPFNLVATATIIVFTIIIAVVFILSRTFKTATTNPTESLRYE